MSNKSNFTHYVKNGEKIKNTFRKTFLTTLNSSYNNSSLEKSNNLKKIVINSVNKDELKLNIRKELKKKLLSSERINYTYINNMNNDVSTFHSFKQGFNLNLFSKTEKFSFLTKLFNNFSQFLKENYKLIYKDFLKYLDLYSKESEIIKNSDVYQYDIFRNVLDKFSKKIELSKSDLRINNSYINLFENLLRDYIHILSKNTNGRCTKFISNFLLFYKKIIILNYEIYSSKILDKEKELNKSKDVINLLNEQINSLEQNIEEYNRQKENFEAIRFNLEEIIDVQAKDIEEYKSKINELETQIQIKNYEINAIKTKLEDLKKNINNSNRKISLDNYIFNNIEDIDYQERLDYDSLLKNRLERVRFLKFKMNLKKNKNNYKESSST